MSWPFLLCVRGIWYTALFRVSLRGVGLRCVGLAQKISARCNTGSYVFSFFFICIFILLLALSHIYVFLFPQRVPSDLEVGYEKSILTRTETFSITICFKEPLLFITLFLKRIFLFGIYFHQKMKLGPDKCFCFVTPKNCVRSNIS